MTDDKTSINERDTQDIKTDLYGLVDRRLLIVSAFIGKAHHAIGAEGWNIEEELTQNGLCHLVITKDDQRKAWGLFEPIYCWTEAYEHATGRQWLTLL